ncbi:MAG: helix-turn-helix transcriptional regulator [Planctomycetes bacterium]|nr:helix-turn-helix transcriptional regulator [Planctomycetota bacterium]
MYFPVRECDRRRHEADVARDPTSKIGEFVRTRRKANNMTQRELGELAGVGMRFVSELERNKPSVRLNVVNKVLGVFGKSLGIVDALKKGEPHEKP